MVNQSPSSISALIGVPRANNANWNSFLLPYQSNEGEGKDDITPSQASFQRQQNNGEYMRTSDLRRLAVLLGVNIAFFDTTGLGWEYYSADINQFARSTLEPFRENEMIEYRGTYPTIFIWGNGGHFQWFQMLASENIWMSDEQATTVNNAVMDAIYRPSDAVVAAQLAAQNEFSQKIGYDKGFVKGELMSKQLRFNRLENDATRIAMENSLETYWAEEEKRWLAQKAAASFLPNLAPRAPSVEESSPLAAPSAQDNTGLKPHPPAVPSPRRKSPRHISLKRRPTGRVKRSRDGEPKPKPKTNTKLIGKKRKPVKYDFRTRLDYAVEKGFITKKKRQKLYDSWMSAKGTGEHFVYEKKLEEIISKKLKKSGGGKRTRKKRRKKKKTRRKRKYHKKTKGRRRRRKKRTRRK